MASPNSSLLQDPFFISSLTLLFLVSLPPPVLSQNPTIAQCTTQLLPLAPCVPFVQGTAMSPAQSCCDNLKLLYSQQPECLCLFLNDTTLSTFPINTTRALQLPVVCSLQVDISTCSGIPVPVPPSSPSSQDPPLGKNTNSSAANSTIAATPMPQTAPIPTTMGLGFSRTANAGTKLKMGSYLAVAFAVAGFPVAGVPF